MIDVESKYSEAKHKISPRTFEGQLGFAFNLFSTAKQDEANTLSFSLLNQVLTRLCVVASVRIASLYYTSIVTSTSTSAPKHRLKIYAFHAFEGNGTSPFVQVLLGPCPPEHVPSHGVPCTGRPRVIPSSHYLSQVCGKRERDRSYTCDLGSFPEAK